MIRIGQAGCGLRTTVLGILCLAASGDARAGLLDNLRNSDLNDYSLGAAVSPSQSPYRDAGGNVIVYPYLTSFRHSVFNDDWLIVRDGDLGARWVNDSGLELGLVGRVATGGFGTGNPLALRGMDDREWTLEAGPTIGWRAWPVHLYLKSYAELLGRRDGNITEFAFMFPREFGWGYLVPSIEVLWQDADYANYYYGVTQREANLRRPEYQPGAATNYAVSLRYGYRLGERWLLSGSVDYEMLDDTIVASPIVGRDGIWSGTIGIAYDADVFQPRDYPYDDLREPAVQIRVGAFFDNISTTIERDADDGSAGTPIDIEDLLGLEDDGVLTQVDLLIRIATFHRLELGYFEFDRSGTTSLGRDIDFGDLILPAGTPVTTRVDTGVLRFSYSYSLMKDNQKELGVTAGLHYTDIGISIATNDGRREAANTTTPLPVLGVHGSASFSPKWQVRAQVAAFWQDFDRYEGYLTSASFDVVRHLSDTISAGIGFNFYRLSLSSSNDGLQGDLISQHYGPLVFLSAGF